MPARITLGLYPAKRLSAPDLRWLGSLRRSFLRRTGCVGPGWASLGDRADFLRDFPTRGGGEYARRCHWNPKWGDGRIASIDRLSFNIKRLHVVTPSPLGGGNDSASANQRQFGRLDGSSGLQHGPIDPRSSRCARIRAAIPTHAVCARCHPAIG